MSGSVVLFGEECVHRDIAHHLAPLLGEPIAGGFCTFEGVPYGSSVSLGLSSRPEDEGAIKRVQGLDSDLF